MTLRRIGFVAAFLLPAILYVFSASWEPGSWDSAELQGVPYILGISHPTGFPFYVLLGFVWSHAIPFGTVAFRLNAMSGIALAIACAAAYGTALEFGASWAVALIATFWLACSQDIWAHATRAESQDLAVACAAVAIYAFVRWMKGAPDGWFLAAFGLFGLGMAAHPNALWLFPAFVVGAAVAKRRPSWRLAAGSLAFAVAGLALYLYLPLRSAYVYSHGLDPTIGLAGIDGGMFWNYNDPRTLHGLIAELTGTESETPGYFLASLNPLHVQDALSAFIAGIEDQFGAFGLVLVVAGAVVAWLRNWRTTLFVCIACTAGLVFSVVYPHESDVGRYRMLDLWIAVPLLGALTPQRSRGAALFWHAALLIFLAAGTAIAFSQQREFLQHSRGEDGRWVISAVRPFVPRGSIIVASWLDATSLAYGAYVDRTLPGRIVVSDDNLRTSLYHRWTPAHRVFVLVNPQEVTALPGARDVEHLDPYHELYEVQ